MFVKLPVYSSNYYSRDAKLINVHSIQSVSECRGYVYVKLNDGSGFECSDRLDQVETKIAQALASQESNRGQ